MNTLLALLKIIMGIIGGSYALIADGIESSVDVVSSLIVWGGLKVSSIPPDKEHPYGHGKAEAIAGACTGLTLLLAASLIVYQSIEQITHPHSTPKWYTLLTLIVVIGVKEALFRYADRVGTDIESTAVKGDAWHHRSDAITSAAAFFGIAIALIGGENYASADDWAALVACSIIYWNGYRILRLAINDLMDHAVPVTLLQWVDTVSRTIAGVRNVSECKIRKSGLGYWVDMHIEVDGDISVSQGHEIAHSVEASLMHKNADVVNVLVHVEPYRYTKSG